MKKPFCLLLTVIGMLTFSSCSSMKKQATAPARPNIETLNAKTFTQTIKTDYLIYLPKDYKAGSRKKWPVIVFLHGSGERGTNVWKATTHGPTKFIEKNPDFPFILVTPLCPAGSKWSDAVVLGLLDKVIETYNVDTNRIYLTGLSMGGYGTWSLATTHPERFAAVAPICGGEGRIGVILSTIDKEKTPHLKDLPIWAFHGAKDTTVPLTESERMVEILRKAGCKEVELTIYPEANHNSWTVTYDNPKLYEWFLKHQTAPKK